MRPPKFSAVVEGIFVGKIRDRWPGKEPSAILKERIRGAQEITATGLRADTQADLSVHGGEEKAIHHYAADHYVNWVEEGHMPAETTAGAFGENITSTGFTENDLCIGDILKLGTATVQISQGRQPCWKLGLHTGNPAMPALFTKTGRTGWYYRVLETGCVTEGDQLTLIERRHPEWSVRRVTLARLTRRIDQHDAETLADLSDLAPGWRAAFGKMAGGDSIEDTSRRLQG